MSLPLPRKSLEEQTFTPQEIVGRFCPCQEEQWFDADEDKRCGYCGKFVPIVRLVSSWDEADGLEMFERKRLRNGQRAAEEARER